MKQCFKCQREQPLSEFYRHPMMADGHLGKCKECTRRDVRERYAANRVARAAYERWRAQTPGRKALKQCYEADHRRRHPDRARARNAVSNAVRDGRLVRQACGICGAANAQAHHDDYGRPLDVRWLCFRCHRERAHGQTVVSI